MSNNLEFPEKDVEWFQSAKRNLEEAASTLNSILHYGQCPLSEALLSEARVLSEASTVLINRIGRK